MNRAAEQAVPEANAFLVGAVKNVSVQDVMIAEQEMAIWKDPVGAAAGMAQKVFGLLGK